MKHLLIALFVLVAFVPVVDAMTDQDVLDGWRISRAMIGQMPNSRCYPNSNEAACKLHMNNTITSLKNMNITHYEWRPNWADMWAERYKGVSCYSNNTHAYPLVVGFNCTVTNMSALSTNSNWGYLNWTINRFAEEGISLILSFDYAKAGSSIDEGSTLVFTNRTWTTNRQREPYAPNVSATGTQRYSRVDISDPKVIKFWVEFVKWFVDNHPGIRGIRYEEPGFWLNSGYCDTYGNCEVWSDTVINRVFANKGYYPVSPTASEDATHRRWNNSKNPNSVQNDMWDAGMQITTDFYGQVRNNITRTYPDFMIGAGFQRYKYHTLQNYNYTQDEKVSKSSSNNATNITKLRYVDYVFYGKSNENGPVGDDVLIDTGSNNAYKTCLDTVRQYTTNVLSTCLISIWQSGFGYNYGTISQMAYSRPRAGVHTGYDNNNIIILFDRDKNGSAAPASGFNRAFGDKYTTVYSYLSTVPVIPPYYNVTPKPTIISWSNNITNSQVLSISVLTGQTVRLNATANQSMRTWHWFENNLTNLTNNNSAINLTWGTPGNSKVQVSASNANGSTQMIEWSITINSITPPTTNFIPPVPESGVCNEASYTISCNWENGTFMNVTDSYNISVTKSVSQSSYWVNGSNNAISIVAQPHENVTVNIHAFNNSGTGSLNNTPLTVIHNVANRNPNLNTIGNHSIYRSNCYGTYISTSDTDGDVISASIVGNGSIETGPTDASLKTNMSASENDIYYEFCPNSTDAIGVHTINLSVTDGDFNGSDYEIFNITILNESRVNGMIYRYGSEIPSSPIPVYLAWNNYSFLNQTTTNEYGYYEFPDNLTSKDGAYYVFANEHNVSANHTNFTVLGTYIPDVDVYLYNEVAVDALTTIDVDFSGSVDADEDITVFQDMDAGVYCSVFSTITGIGSCDGLEPYAALQFRVTDGHGFYTTQTVFNNPDPNLTRPNITSWRNNKTNNLSKEIIINTSEDINFNATANQTIDTWTWGVNGSDQSVNFNNTTVSWTTPGLRNISVNGTNINGTTDTIYWNITVVNISAPGGGGTPSYIPPTPTDCISLNGTNWINVSCSAGAGNITNGMNFTNTNLSTHSNGTAFFWNNTGLTEGTLYIYHVYAFNNTAGNLSLTYATVSNTTNTTPLLLGTPNITAYYNNISGWNQTAGTINSNNYAFFNATINQSITDISFKLNGTVMQNTSTANYTHFFDTVGQHNITIQANSSNGSSQVVYTVVTVVTGGAPPPGGGTDWDFLTGTVNIAGATITTNPNVGSTTGGAYTFGYVFVDGQTYWINVSKTGYYSNNTQITFNEDHEIWNPILTESVSPSPNITSFSNNNTNDNALILSVQEGTTILFNITANQTLTGCSWTGATQINCTGNISHASKTFSVLGVNTVIAQGTSANGTTQTITWTVTVTAIPATPSTIYSVRYQYGCSVPSGLMTADLLQLYALPVLLVVVLLLIIITKVIPENPLVGVIISVILITVSGSYLPEITTAIAGADDVHTPCIWQTDSINISGKQDTWISLTHNQIKVNSQLVYNSSYTGVNITDYTMDYPLGRIQPLSTGLLNFGP